MAVMSETAAPSQLLDTPAPGRYLVSPEQSTVILRTRHLFGLGAVRATLALRDGRIVVAGPPEKSVVQARFAVPSFESGNPSRDAAVLSRRLLDAEAFPSITFTSTELVRSGQHWSLRGELEVHGVTRPVEARITALRADGSTLNASAQAVIDRYDFGVTAYRGLAARKLTIDLTVTAHREES
jgi:polyisoprenoid-binding protein YceI